jgi:hypothetical protein
LGESIDHPLDMPFKTLESKETKAQRKKTVTHNSVFAAHRLMPDGDFKIDIRHFPIRASGFRPIYVLKSRARDFVKPPEEIMRGIIIKSISQEEIEAVRHVRAVEGYVDLGMFEEAEEALRELDPAWFASERVLSLQLRVLAGLASYE